jgi:adenine-specific DNA-methyltransferase
LLPLHRVVAVIKYLGSKRTLLPSILAAIHSIPDVHSVLDVFAGTSRVGFACKAAGLRVVANDHNSYAATLARCYVQANESTQAATCAKLIAELQRLPPRAGYVTERFCQQARYFTPENGARIDAMREQIAAWCLAPELEAVVLVSLMEAADRVDSTCGLQMAYLKQYAARALQPIHLRVPQLCDARRGPCLATQLEAVDAVQQHEVDVAYLDPPYNQHSYLGNYHVWESLVRWDKPDTYGVANKRVDVKTRASEFNRKATMRQALMDVITHARARALVVSFSDEGFLSQAELEAMLSTRGPVTTSSFDYKRYVGAQIGIYNPQGARVGRVSHVRNQERLYVVHIAN